MKKKTKRLVLSVIAILLLVISCVGIRLSPVLLGVDIPAQISHFFNPPNVANDSLGWNLMLVNYQNHIPDDYNPSLTELSNGQKVDSRIYGALQEMFEDAQSEGVYMVVAAGYRTRQKQQSLMKERILGYMSDGYSYFKAEKLAKKWVAAAGTSEHQLGLAVDINQNPALCSADKVYDWLLSNAHKYGFVKRYPADKVEITKIANEPWHYRYVGKQAAAEMTEKDLCLEEYVELLKS